MERTLVVIKPDGVQRGLVGRIIQRFEDAGLKIIALKQIQMDKDFAGQHYHDVAKRRGEDIFRANIKFVVDGPVVAFVLEGVEAIETVRKMVGDTEPKSAPPGTIRGDFAHQSFQWKNQGNVGAIRNLIHASSSQEDAKREIELWFLENEIHSYDTVYQKHTF